MKKSNFLNLRCSKYKKYLKSFLLICHSHSLNGLLASQNKGNILRTKFGFDDPKGACANRKKI